MSLADTPTSLSAENDARILYDYHRMSMPLQQSAEAIFTLCSFDLRVAHRAVDLIGCGKGQYLIFSGGHGKRTTRLFTKPEAEVFADVALARGVPKEQIILEKESTNTGENVRFTYSLLNSMGLNPRKQWPDPAAQFSVTSPELRFDEYPCRAVSKDLFITVMVETLLRIRDYPERGFQITQDISDEV